MASASADLSEAKRDDDGDQFAKVNIGDVTAQDSLEEARGLYERCAVTARPDRLAEIVAHPSIGTIGDSYDSALADSQSGFTRMAGRPVARLQTTRAAKPDRVRETAPTIISRVMTPPNRGISKVQPTPSVP